LKLLTAFSRRFGKLNIRYQLIVYWNSGSTLSLFVIQIGQNSFIPQINWRYAMIDFKNTSKSPTSLLWKVYYTEMVFRYSFVPPPNLRFRAEQKT